MGIKKIDYQQSFNRNLFFLYLDNEIIKTEFTYFPFPRIETTIKKYKFNLEDLIKKAKVKFDWHMDFLQLGSQFFKAQAVKDFPKMKIKENRKEWQKFFLNEAKTLKKRILN